MVSKFRYVIYPEYIYKLDYIDGTIEISGEEIINAFKINPESDEDKEIIDVYEHHFPATDNS